MTNDIDRAVSGDDMPLRGWDFHGQHSLPLLKNASIRGAKLYFLQFGLADVLSVYLSEAKLITTRSVSYSLRDALKKIKARYRASLPSQRSRGAIGAWLTHASMDSLTLDYILAVRQS